MRVAFLAQRVPGGIRLPRYSVTVMDARRRRVATLLREPARPTGGVVHVDWDGRDDQGRLLMPGSYLLSVRGVDNTLRLERTVLVEG